MNRYERRITATLTSAASEYREIDLHRRVCRITPDVIEVRPARSVAVVPFLGLMLGIFAFVSVVLWINSMPFYLTLALMTVALLLVPFSGMGFVYSIWGANVVINRKKQTAVWQQGMFGMGVGTEELAPFAKIERVEIEDISPDPLHDGVREFVQFELRLLKVSGRTLALGQITVPREIEESGLARAREVGTAVAELIGKPLAEIGIEQRQRRFRKRAQPSA